MCALSPESVCMCVRAFMSVCLREAVAVVEAVSYFLCLRAARFLGPCQLQLT